MDQNYTENADGQNVTPIHRRWWFWVAMVIVAVLIITFIADGDGQSGGNGQNGIKIVEEKLVTTGLQVLNGNNVYPIVQVTVKNTSNKTKAVWFDVNIYANGELIDSASSTTVTLTPGDQATIKAQSSYGYYVGTKEYTYKITKWVVLDQ